MGALEFLLTIWRWISDFFTRPFVWFGLFVSFLTALVAKGIRYVLDLTLDAVLSELPSLDFLDSSADLFGWLSKLFNLSLAFDLLWSTVLLVVASHFLLILLVPISSAYHKLFR